MKQFSKTFLLLITSLFIVYSSLGQRVPSEVFEKLNFRFIGPEGNRAIAIIGEPGNPMVSYIGAASGGLWKTEDGGVRWKPIFDDQEVSSISAIDLAPSDPQQVWIGTGETFLIRPAHSLGNGIYKSPDGGKTWQHMGLEKTARISRVIVHPKNPDIVYVAALGHTYGNQTDRGIYKTLNGGESWERILFTDAGTGASDLAIDPENPDILYAAMWSIHINTWGLNSGGHSGGIYRTKDGGKTWESMTKKGLPGGAMGRNVGKTAVAVARSNPNVVYALFEIESPELWRSDDKGETWTLQSQDHSMNERAPYYTRIVVAPDNEDEVFFLSVRFGQSKDKGKTLEKSPPRGGGDNHDMWIDPTNPNRMMVAHDGCASFTMNDGKSFQRIVLPIAQMYHASTDNKIPYNVFGNRQDGYSYMGPSNSLQGYIPLGLWRGVGGCESGFARPDPFDNNIIWSGCYDGGLERHNLKTGHSREVRVWPEASYGWSPSELKYRWHWNFPLSFSPHVKHRVYVGSQYVHKSDDGGQSWQIISPDLTLNDKTHQQSSGGVAIDNLMTFDGSTLFAIEESPLEAGLIWVGSNDGQVNITRDGGETWNNVTENIPNLPPWGTIANIAPSKYSASTAYISVDLHQMGDFKPYIYKTSDYGKSWEKISQGIPNSILSFVHVVKEDPRRKGMLYAGTDNSIYITYDDGKNWTLLRNNLPPAPIYWLDIQEHFDDLVIATYGRGYYILDDLGAIRNMPEAFSNDMKPTLFKPRNTYRFNKKEGIKTDSPSLNNGKNPSYGTAIRYYLNDSAKNVTAHILNAKGDTVRTLKGSADVGLNTMQWNLRYSPVLRPKLRVQPPGRPWVQLNGEGWRPLVTWDLDLMAGQYGPRVAPGEYSVQVVSGEKFIGKASFKVLKDPHSEGTQTDIEEQVKLALELRNAMNIAVLTINSIELIRKDLETILAESKDKKITKEALRLKKIAEEIAGKLYDIHLTGAREDAFRSPMKLYGRLSALASDLNGSGIDFRPTDQQDEVYNLLNNRLEAVQENFNNFVQKDIQSFSDALKKQGKEMKNYYFKDKNSVHINQK